MPNNVTFNIEETPEGEFALYLHNHGQKHVSEQCRSKDLDKVVKKLKEEMNYRRHFNNAMYNYMPVFNRIDELCDKYPEVSKEQFPEDWGDPLELYGCFADELIAEGMDLDYERDQLSNLMKDHTVEWVWDNRRRLVA